MEFGLCQVREGAGRGRGARRGGGRQEAHPGNEDDREASVHQLRHLGQRQGQSFTVLTEISGSGPICFLRSGSGCITFDASEFEDPNLVGTKCSVKNPNTGLLLPR